MKSDFSPSRRTWNVIMTAVVWAAAVLVIALTVGVIGLVLVRGIPHISWEFLSTTASVLKGTDGILPAILNTFYVILLTLLIVLPLGVGAAVYLTEYASNKTFIRIVEFATETLAGAIRRDEQQIDMRPDGGDKANRLAVDHGHQAD